MIICMCYFMYLRDLRGGCKKGFFPELLLQSPPSIHLPLSPCFSYMCVCILRTEEVKRLERTYGVI